MKIVIAPDSFKHSASAARAAEAIAEGVRRAAPAAECVMKPMADGGEGTVDAMLAAVPGSERRTGVVTGSDGGRLEAAWGWLGDGRAVIEMAAAAGIELVDPRRNAVELATTIGVGEQIRAALDAGATRILLGLGGSATNDGGAGMLSALGARLLDADGRPLPPGGAALARLARIDLDGLDPRLGRVRIAVACDVDNPLCGPEGASAVFGPQKGATPAQVATLDAALARFADVAAATLGRDLRDTPGAGAAGGMGFAALAFLGARFAPGVDLVAEANGLADAMTGADLVITGEGRLDAQSLHGKTPVGVARIAARAGVPVVALAGSLGDGFEAVYGAGIAAAFSLAPGPLTLEEAIARTPALLAARAEALTRLWLAAGTRPHR